MNVRSRPSSGEIAIYTMMTEMHVAPSELGIDMNDIAMIMRFMKVHSFIKKMENKAMPKMELDGDKYKDNPNMLTYENMEVMFNE